MGRHGLVQCGPTGTAILWFVACCSSVCKFLDRVALSKDCNSKSKQKTIDFVELIVKCLITFSDFISR